jgi:hypothetical protein
MKTIQIRLPFQVTAINAKNKPDGIPDSKWIVEGQKYTVIAVAKLLIQGGIIGFKLEELNIDDCFPYQYFAASRFAIQVNINNDVEEELARLLEEAKEEFKEIESL